MAPKTHRLSRVRNIGIIAHIDAGKTTLTERLLYVTGRTHKMGEVHDGAAVMDYLPQEQERGITITSAVTALPWRNVDVHLIDTPGHVDFTIEVARSLRVLDGAVVVLDGVGGVEPQTETVWHQADRRGVPRIAFVNKLDRPGASFRRSLESLRDHFSQCFVPLQVPVGAERDFRGVVDLLSGKTHIYSGTDPRDEEVLDEIPAELREKAEAARAELLEGLADHDDEIALAYLEGEEISEERLIEALREHTLSGAVVPVLCGSALRNKGVPPVLDAIARYLPAPPDRPPITGRDPETDEEPSFAPEPKGPMVALIYKVERGEDGRRLCFTRLYSGTLKVGETLAAPGREVEERIARVFQMHANRREQRLDRAVAGDIVALMGPRKAGTGDTLCGPGVKVLLEPIDTYRPVVNLAVEPAAMRERDDLLVALDRVTDEDPTFFWREDEETGQIVVSGMGELHLEVVLERVRRRHKIELRAGRPMVLTREALAGPIEGEGSFEAEVEDQAARATVRLTMSPRERDAGYSFEVAPEVHVSDQALERVRRTVFETLESGPIHGDPIVDVAVKLLHLQAGGSLEVAGALPIAGANAVRSALKEAETLRLEPLMALEVQVPPEHVGETIGSVNARRGQVSDVEEDSLRSVVRAVVPLSQMFGYATVLRNLSQGRGTFTMTFLRYDVV